MNSRGVKELSTYSTIAGDTFDKVARKKYGNEKYAGNILSANSGIVEPISEGTVLVIPDLADAPPKKVIQDPSTSENEVVISIDQKRFRYWERPTIIRSIDAISTVNFTTPLEEAAPEFRETFRPFSFKPLSVSIGGDPIVTGTLISPTPQVTPQRSAATIDGYGLPGVLSDCAVPEAAYPLEFNKVPFDEIAAKLAGIFGVATQFDVDPGGPFKRVGLGVGQKVMPFLTSLAQQRNLISSDTPMGKLVFPSITQAGSPVVSLVQGQSPLIEVIPTFNPQLYFSHVTGFRKTKAGAKGAKYTMTNPHLAGVSRPFSFTATDTDGGDLKTAVAAKMGRMFANAASYRVVLSTWRDPQGALWDPNTTLKLLYPKAFIYDSYEFLIRSVQFVKQADSEIAILNAIIPDAFAGIIPEVVPWPV